MTISSLTASLAASTAAPATTTAKTSTDATADTSAVTRAMTKVDARLQDQLDTATTQLSSFGKLKASVSDAQQAARALGGLAATSNVADVKAAANSFINAFNAALATSKTTAQGNSSSAEAGGARHVGSDLSRSIGASSTTIDSLRKLGIKQAADGSLSMDAAKFDAAGQAGATSMRAVLAGVGQAVDKTATAGLATGGQLGFSITSLSQRFSTLVSHRKALLKMEQNFSTTASDSSSSSATSSVTGNVNTALAAYLQNR